MSSEILQFLAPEIQVDPAFWRWLADFKLTQQRLSTASFPLTAFETAKDGVIYLPAQSELESYRAMLGDRYVREYTGTLFNLNTIEDFLAFDRKAALAALASTLHQHSFQFLLVSFADLKSFKFTFNCAFPVLAPSPPLRRASDAPASLVWSVRVSLYRHFRLGEACEMNFGASEAPDAVWTLQPGWVRFGDTVTKNVDLRQQMDPEIIARRAVTLNIELMKWRIVPELVHENFAHKKFLLLGAGTLGCAVARGLVAWGVRTVTFVDSGKISFSNPVRQSLFTFEDARLAAPKAETAATRLGEVTPGLEVLGVTLEIPMPSHENGNSLAEYERLSGLIDAHDVVLLLTDSRESRYFPSVISAARNKLAVSVALGFDSFLVKIQKPQVSACYFCNDVAAPNDSTSHRSLDLQCTVTRPGVSSIASNLAVEILAAIFTNAGQSPAFSTDPHTATLGAVPDQVRGFLADFRLAPAVTEPNPQCICCSRPVLDAFLADSENFVLRATKDPAFLEDLSELKTAQSRIDTAAVLAFDSEDDQF